MERVENILATPLISSRISSFRVRSAGPSFCGLSFLNFSPNQIIVEIFAC